MKSLTPALYAYVTRYQEKVSWSMSERLKITPKAWRTREETAEQKVSRGR